MKDSKIRQDHNVNEGANDVSQFVLTLHAQRRMAQRNVSLADVRFVLKHGKRFHRAGAVFVHLRGKDIPKEKRHDKNITRLEGTTVVLSRRNVLLNTLIEGKLAERQETTVVSHESPIILTIWRNSQDGLRHIKRKVRYGRRGSFTGYWDEVVKEETIAAIRPALLSSSESGV